MTQVFRRRRSIGQESKTVLVYNQFSIDAQFAAAIVASSFYGHPLAVFNNTQIVPDDADRYIWVGLEPTLKGKSAQRFKPTAEHSVLGRAEETSSWKDRLRSVLALDRASEAKKYDVTNREMSLMDHAVATYGAYNTLWDENHDIELLKDSAMPRQRLMDLNPSSPVQKISALINNFYSRDLSEHELVMLFVNWRAATQALAGKERFGWTDVKASDVDDWFEFVASIKTRLSGNVDSIVLTNRRTSSRETYLVTSWSDKDYSWAMRMVQFSHRRIVNLVDTLSGRVVTSPTNNVNELKLNFGFRSSNVY